MGDSDQNFEAINLTSDKCRTWVHRNKKLQSFQLHQPGIIYTPIVFPSKGRKKDKAVPINMLNFFRNPVKH